MFTGAQNIIAREEAYAGARFGELKTADLGPETNRSLAHTNQSGSWSSGEWRSAESDLGICLFWFDHHVATMMRQKKSDEIGGRRRLDYFTSFLTRRPLIDAGVELNM